MSEYQVLARKWRPQKFSELLGQDHIVKTLRNAIRSERVAHAYLFVGPRGVGKTTTARILAKALNCPQPINDGDGFVDPCGECDTCTEIAEGACLDVLEIDGASHNSVGHIRELRDNVVYTPSHGRKVKVYIIDEVHMLSTAAWNALLKTLEEPPPHVIFIFATTEAHKVLPTILSRCQRFDLTSLPVNIILRRLKEIAEKESISVDEAALTAVARCADGSMRDSQSILDQLISFSGGPDGTPISENDVIDVFGLVSRQDLIELASAVVDNSAGAVIEALHRFAGSGRNLERVYADLQGLLRNLAVIQLVTDPARVLDLSAAELQDLLPLSQKTDAAVIHRLLDGLISRDAELRHALNKTLAIEASILITMRNAHAAQVDDIISKLRGMSSESGPAGATAPGPTPVPSPDPDPTPSPPDDPPKGQSDRGRTPDNVPDNSRRGGSGDLFNASGSTPAAENSGRSTSRLDRPVEAPPPRDAEGGSPFDRNAPHDRRDENEGRKKPDLTKTSIISMNAVREVRARSISEFLTSEDSREEATRLWHAIEAEIDKIPKIGIARDHLKEAIPLACDDGLLTIGFSDDFPPEHAAEMENPRMQKIFERCLERICDSGRAPRMMIVRVQESFNKTTVERFSHHLDSSKEVWKRVETSEFVNNICETFKGKIVDARG